MAITLKEVLLIPEVDITDILNKVMEVPGVTDITGRLQGLGEAVIMLQEGITDFRVDILIIRNRVHLEGLVATSHQVMEVLDAQEVDLEDLVVTKE